MSNSGWIPCPHIWAQISESESPVTQSMCLICGDEKEEATGAVPDGEEGMRAGWRTVETNVDTIEEHVRVTISEIESGRIVYSARYSPETARSLARALTLRSFELDDAE